MSIEVDGAIVGMGAAVENAGAATMAGTTSAAAAAITGVVPPTTEDAGAAAAAGFMARGAETMAVLSQLTGARGLFGATMGANGLAYTAVDGVNAVISSI